MAAARRGGAGGEPGAPVGPADPGFARGSAGRAVVEGAAGELARSGQGFQPAAGVTPQQGESDHPQSGTRLSSPQQETGGWQQLHALQTNIKKCKSCNICFGFSYNRYFIVLYNK